MAMTPKSDSGMANVRENGDFTDFGILCGEERIDVHRIVICGKSSVFYRACTSRFSEATSRTYRIDDFPFAVVERMVEYMYTGDYFDPDEGSPSEDATNGLSILLVHITMVSLADKYDIQGLVALAAKKYGMALDDDEDFEAFTDSVPEIYRMPAEVSQPLREAAMVFARNKVRAAMDYWGGLGKFEELLEEFPQFARELLCSIIRRPLTPTMGYCGHCKDRKTKVPVSIERCRCLKCGREGATPESEDW